MAKTILMRAFEDEYVKLYTLVESGVNEDGPILSVFDNEGYLFSQDQNFFYLADEEGIIVKAVRKDIVSKIEIIKAPLKVVKGKK